MGVQPSLNVAAQFDNIIFICGAFISSSIRFIQCVLGDRPVNSENVGVAHWEYNSLVLRGVFVRPPRQHGTDSSMGRGAAQTNNLFKELLFDFGRC
jgi:hypothetical protein